MKKMEEIPFTEQQKEFLQLDKLQNPQLLVLNHKNIKNIHQLEHTLISSDLYTITLNPGIIDSLKYGRNYYDFKDGTLIFLTPGQTFMIEKPNIDDFSEGWSLHFHPNLVRNSSLYEKLKSYTFFSYNINEALHVKKEEKEVITTLIKAIEQESSTKLDANTQNILIAYIDLLLSYCNRFYERQFNTRKVINKDTASKFEQLLKDYYDNRLQFEHGLPTPRYCAETLWLFFVS